MWVKIMIVGVVMSGIVMLYHSNVCVCVCEREREREREN